MASVGILICPCGKIEKTKIEELKSMVKEVTNDLDYVKLGDPGLDNCIKIKKGKLEALRAEFNKLILLTCSQYSQEVEKIINGLQREGFESHLIKVINIDILKDLPNDDLREKLTTLISMWGTYLNNISTAKLTVTVTRFKSKMKRRDIVKLISKGFIERRFLPIIRKDFCVIDKGCTKCIDYCPVDALKIVDKKERKIEVYETKCVSCGICESICPTNAIEVHGSTRNVIMPAIQKAVETSKIKPILVFSCGARTSRILEEKTKIYHGEPNLVPFELECVGRIDPLTILELLQMGVRGVILTDCDGICPYKIKNPLIKENYKYALSLLEAFNIDKKLIDIINVNDEENLDGNLNKAVKKIMESEGLKLTGEHIDIEPGEVKFRKIINKFTEISGIEPEGTFKSELYGPVNIKIEKTLCTMCEVCAKLCPTSALKIEGNEDKVKLVFIQSNCVACGYCEEVCPENALKLYNQFDVRIVALNVKKELKEDIIIKCKNCGRPIGPQASIKKVERLLKIRWASDPKKIDFIYYCERCKFLKSIGQI